MVGSNKSEDSVELEVGSGNHDMYYATIDAINPQIKEETVLKSAREMQELESTGITNDGHISLIMKVSKEVLFTIEVIMFGSKR